MFQPFVLFSKTRAICCPSALSLPQKRFGCCLSGPRCCPTQWIIKNLVGKPKRKRKQLSPFPTQSGLNLDFTHPGDGHEPPSPSPGLMLELFVICHFGTINHWAQGERADSLRSDRIDPRNIETLWTQSTIKEQLGLKIGNN